MSLCHESIVRALGIESLKRRCFPFVTINQPMGGTDYMDGLGPKHLPADICVGTYGKRHFLAIKTMNMFWGQYYPTVTVVFQRYDDSDLIVSNRLPNTIVNKSDDDRQIILALLEGKTPTNYPVKPLNPIPKRLTHELGMQDINFVFTPKAYTPKT
jgi:hypothetical protein